MKLKQHEEATLYSGFWGQLKYLFQTPVSNDEFTLRDRQKVPIYLQVSLHNLMDMFNVSDEVKQFCFIQIYFKKFCSKTISPKLMQRLYFIHSFLLKQNCFSVNIF